ncbi:hypothetical protein TSMEX_000712 [Taenia solium]|eukprot:TsM_000289300 transcript=TsM_000289300 gene=TsM_000289300
MIRLQSTLRGSSPIDQLFALPGPWNKSPVVMEMLRALATAISQCLIEIDKNEVVKRAKEDNVDVGSAGARQFLYERKLVQAMENLLAMNMPEMFNRSKKLS